MPDLDAAFLTENQSGRQLDLVQRQVTDPAARLAVKSRVKMAALWIMPHLP
jgi:hypothetical protein